MNYLRLQFHYDRIIHATILATILCAALAVASCASIGPKGVAAPTATPLPPARDTYVAYGKTFYALDPVTGNTKWTFQMRQQYGYGTPFVSQGVVYISDLSTVYALQADSGKMLWQAAMNGNPNVYPSPSFPMEVNGILYIESGEGKDNGNSILLALSASNGKALWTYPLGTAVLAQPPIYVHGVVIVMLYQHPLLAINARTGALEWSIQQSAQGVSFEGVATDGTDIYATTDTLNATGVSALNDRGQTLWTATAETGTLGSNLAEVSPPVVANGTVYFYSGDQSVFAVDASDGTLKWHNSSINFLCGSEDPGGAPAIYGGQLFYTADTCATTIAVNLSDGSLLWINNQVGNIFTPVQSSGSLIVSTGKRVTGLDPHQGNVLWNVSLPLASDLNCGDGMADGFLCISGPAA